MQPSEFDKDIEVWWEPLLEFGNTPSDLKTQIVTLASVEIPNKKRLDKMILLLEQLPDGLKELLVTQAKAIISGKYKEEFGRKYNDGSIWHGQCSSTSSFFSQIKQSIAYNDPIEVTP